MLAKRAAIVVVSVAMLVAGCGDANIEQQAPLTVTSSIETSSSPSASTPVARPPFIDKAEWASTPQGPSLQVFPTASGRRADAEADMGIAWREVVEKAPDAKTPGMQAQFDCHWKFARIVDPDKTSWNLEPWRPVVSESEMVSSRCNPGGAEESLPTTAGSG